MLKTFGLSILIAITTMSFAVPVASAAPSDQSCQALLERARLQDSHDDRDGIRQYVECIARQG